MENLSFSFFQKKVFEDQSECFVPVCFPFSALLEIMVVNFMLALFKKMEVIQGHIQRILGHTITYTISSFAEIVMCLVVLC